MGRRFKSDHEQNYNDFTSINNLKNFLRYLLLIIYVVNIRVKMAKNEMLKHISTFFFIMAFTTLVYRVYKTRDVKNISYTWILLVIISQFFLFTYGICNNKLEAVISSIYILFGVLYIFGFKEYVTDSDKEIIEQLRNKDIL